MEVLRRNDKGFTDSLLRHTDIEVCKLFKGLSSNPLFTMLLNVGREIENGLHDICEKTGEIKIHNISHHNSSGSSFWPAGEFKTVTRIFDDLDDNIVNGTFYGTTFR